MLALDSVAMTYPTSDGTIELFRNLTLAVWPGELVAVVGRSGSGKTTLLRIASAMLRPVAGSVRWNGELVDHVDDGRLVAWRAGHLGIVFQGAALIDTLTAAENVAIAAIPSRARGVMPLDPHDLLGKVGVSNRSRHFPRQLSGGEQQRVALARALFSDPPLLIVDEPTANLDRRSADEVIELLGSLARDGRGLLVASHDPHLVGVADRVIELESTSQPR
jgi:putative ABC transport system ATP-binding protein